MKDNMSTQYAIDAILNTECNEENINFLLKKGLKLGFTYFGKDLSDVLNTNQATARLLYGSNPCEKDNNFRIIEVKFEDTYFYLHITALDAFKTEIGISPTVYEWYKDFDNFYTIDFARYIRTFLKLINDFTLLKLEVNTI